MPEETEPLLRDANEQPSYEATNRVEAGEAEVQKPEPSFRNLLLKLAPLVVGVFLAAMDATIVVSSYATMGNDLNGLQKTSWISTAYMLTLTSFQPLYGKLSDIFGRKTCLLMAYTIFGLGSLFCGLASNIDMLILSRAFAGIGGGGMTTVVSVILTDLVPLRARGTWQGILNIVFAVGASSGAPIGGLLADTIGWRWSFLFQVPIAFIAMISVHLSLQNTGGGDKDAEQPLMTKIRRVDFPGAVTLVCAVFALLLALDLAGNTSYTSPLVVGIFLTSAFFTIIFLIIEARVSAEPFAPLRITTNSSLLGSYLCNFFGFGAGIAVVFHVSLYYQAVLKWSAVQAGAGLLPSTISGVTGSLFGGLVMQKTGKYYVLTIASYISLTIGIIIIDLMGGTILYSFLGVFGGLVFLSFGNGIGVTSTLIALISNVDASDQAIATAVSYLFRSLGSVVGLSIDSSLVQSTLRSYLYKHLEGEDVEEIVRSVRVSLDNIDLLKPQTRVIVRAAYETAVHSAFRFSAAMAFCAVICAVFIREKPLARK